LLTPDVATFRRRLEAWLGLATIVKVSAEDLGWAAPGESVAEAARLWRGKGASLVVVTRGGDGVYALGPHGVVDLPANPVKLVDTVGAGDSFTAGFLAALPARFVAAPGGLADLDNDTLTGALQYALRVAAVTCSRPGADPPWAHELA